MIAPPPQPRPLSAGDLRLLRLLAALVPAAERQDWHRGWHAELWHARFGAPARRARPARRLLLSVDLAFGIALDALWLRRECWLRRYHGTAVLCLVSLASLCFLAALIAAYLAGNDPRRVLALDALLLHTVFATPLVLFVGGARGWRYTESSAGRAGFASVRRTMFLAAKTLLVLTLAALLSTDLCLPLHLQFRGMSDVLQQLCFVLLGLLGLRWSFTDQETRCKHCLRALASPERVGRASHNLLEWAGTEQVCLQGHGALASPEMVSSWAEHNRWVDHHPRWQTSVNAS